MLKFRSKIEKPTHLPHQRRANFTLNYCAHSLTASPDSLSLVSSLAREREQAKKGAQRKSEHKIKAKHFCLYNCVCVTKNCVYFVLFLLSIEL